MNHIMSRIRRSSAHRINEPTLEIIHKIPPSQIAQTSTSSTERQTDRETASDYNRSFKIN